MVDIIGYHMSGKTLVNSRREETHNDYLTWLAAQPEEALKIFYNLNYAVSQLLREIGISEEQGQKILDSSGLYYPPYEIKYVPDKFLSVKHGFYKGAPFSSYADASQYDKSLPIKADDGFDYCLDCSNTAKELGTVVYNALVKVGLHPTTLVSPISAFSKEILNHMNLPTVDDIPLEAAEMAYECCHGNWVETYIKGHWDKAYDYDLSSAYPSEVARLMDTRYGKWYNYPLYMPEAAYGYCQGVVSIDEPLHPILYSSNNNRNYTPVGEWEGIITKNHWDYLTGRGDFSCSNAWWWVPKKTVYPFKAMISKLYELKEQSSGLEREVIKRIPNGIYGYFLQLRRGVMGDAFNPVWGAEIESRVGIKVAEFCHQAEEIGAEVISVAVDGVTITNKIPDGSLLIINGGSNEGAGKWKLSAECPCLSIASGLVALQDKYGGLDFSLDYNYLVDKIRRNPSKKSIVLKKKSFVGVAKALQVDKWDNLGELETISRTIDLSGGDLKRIYLDSPANGGDLMDKTYHSEPLDINLVKE